MQLILQELARYEANLDDAKTYGIQKGFVNGASMGVVFMLMFCSYALAFWYGSVLFEDGISTPGDIMTVSCLSAPYRNTLRVCLQVYSFICIC